MRNRRMEAEGSWQPTARTAVPGPAHPRLSRGTLPTLRVNLPVLRCPGTRFISRSGWTGLCPIRLQRNAMAWTTPTLVEICIGLEINGYLPAEF
jgi:coenzyme PQQ precursor peptide PqqA